MNVRNLSFAPMYALIVALGAALSGCSGSSKAQPPAPEIVSGVAVITAQRTSITDWLEAVGTVEAAQTSRIASQMTGNIVEIGAQEGDRVQSGQILATIDDTQPRAAVERAAAGATAAEEEVVAADSDFTLAETTLHRYQQLYEKKSVSPQEFDEFQARYQSAAAQRDMARAREGEANAALAQARTSLGYARIRAPFTGLVTEKMADVGTLASAGMPVFTIEDTGNYRLDATVDESDIAFVHAGQGATVLLDALGSAGLSGKVVQIVPAADPASRSFLVKIALPADARLRSGLFGRARFARGQRSALLIPRSAIVERGQLEGVYAIGANKIAELRYVTLGMTEGQQVEVLSGLQEGDTFLAAPGSRDLGGKEVELSQ